ncbi:hypothetical protein DFJ73DRAFT_385183 [Zopfochytrium polystomum]|nr:hypothetical protein DFJ73DRAFT_385183 [Zopfochytrium polystomum]
MQVGQQPLSGRSPSPSMDSSLYYSILCQHNRMPARPTHDFTARQRTASQPHIVSGIPAAAAAASLQSLPHPPQQLVAIPADLVEGLNAFEIGVSVFQKQGAIAGGGGGVLADLAAQAGISITGSGVGGADLFVPLDGARQTFSCLCSGSAEVEGDNSGPQSNNTAQKSIAPFKPKLIVTPPKRQSASSSWLS